MLKDFIVIKLILSFIIPYITLYAIYIQLNAGLFIMLTSDNYVRKIIGLGVFQSSLPKIRKNSNTAFIKIITGWFR